MNTRNYLNKLNPEKIQFAMLVRDQYVNPERQRKKELKRLKLRQKKNKRTAKK